MSADHSYTGDPEVDRLLFSWRRVIGSTQGWARSFALSIQRARKKPEWQPSAKQLSVMQQLVAELPQHLPDEADLIERD